MRHYTFSLLTIVLLSTTFHGCLDAQTQSFNIYNNCNEYYDSRGFYHKQCDDQPLDKRELRKSFKELKAEIDPGEGEETNTTKKGKLASTIDEIIEDKSPEDPTIKGRDNPSESLTPAIPERPELEFGRQE